MPDEAVAQADQLIREHRNRILELEGTKVFAEIYGPPPRLLVYGAVDTAEAMCKAAKLLGWRAIVADARQKFATKERIPSADEIIVEWPEEALAQVAPDHATAIVVLTHDDKFDVPALKAALETEAFYIGALGSRRNQERRRERLLEAGVDEEALERINGPVRARHRRRDAARDGALDPRRGACRPDGPRRRQAEGVEEAHPRRGGGLVTERVEKTDEQWKAELDEDRYAVLRCGATEAPWSGELNVVHDDGMFRCGACGAALFSSDTKFDSGSGWPSFFAPLSEETVELEEDLSHGMRRTEVRCAAVRLAPRPRVPRRPASRRAFATASTRSRSTSSRRTASGRTIYSIGISKRAMIPSSPSSGTGRSGWRVATHATPLSG